MTLFRPFVSLQVSQVLAGGCRFDRVVWSDESSRNNPAVIRSTVLNTPSGPKAAIELL
jgi:hypothetical protein